MSALKPEDLGLARELAEIYLQRNDQKRALAKLQVCFKADPRDIDTLRLLATAFQGLGQTSKTISVYKELARAYADRGQHTESEQTWDQVAQLDPNDPDVAARRPAAVAPEPEPMMPQRTGTTGAAPVYTPQPPVTAAAPVYQPRRSPVPTAPPPEAAAPKRTDSLGKLLTETDVYVKYGLHDKALEHLRKVFAVEPENIDAHEKAYAIYVASNNHAQAAEQLLNVLRLHTRIGDRERAAPYLNTILQQNPSHPEVPVFVQLLGTAATGAAPSHDSQAEMPDDAILVDSSDDEVIVADEPGDEPISAEVAISGEEAIEAPEYVPDEMAIAPDDAAAAAQVEVDPPPVADEYVEPAPIVSDEEGFEPPTASMALSEEPRTGEFEAPAVIEDELPPDPEPLPEPDAFDATPALGTPSLGDDAHEAPTRAMKAFDPSLLGAALRTQQVAPVKLEDLPRSGGPSSTMSDEEEFEPPPVEPPQDLPLEDEVIEQPQAFAPEEPVEQPVEAPPEDEPASEECDEATFFIEQGLLDEAREILETVLIAYPDHQRAARLLAQVEGGGAAPTVDAPPPAVDGAPLNGESKDAFDLAQELADELGDFGGEAEAAAPALGGDDDYQVSVEEVFAEFKKGLEKVVKPEDVDTHYDLGIAYKEMGLVDDAISEFTIARKGCVGKKKEVDCLTMAGLLQMQKGDFAMAVDAFLQALTSEHATGEVEKATRFELAAAYEGAGHAGRALTQYLKVQASDPDYRDVSTHVDRLSAVATPEDDPPSTSGGGGPPPKKGGSSGASPSRKVGYV